MTRPKKQTALQGSYILESDAENERLERQSRMKAFDFKLELQFLEVREGQKILDAGCGTGIVSDYLASRASDVSVTGWDFSKDRIDAAKAKYGSAKNISFEQRDLLNVKDGATFDTIVCRYVLRHFSASDTKKVIQNLFKVLKPGGTLYCVDVVGLLEDVHPTSPFLKKSLRLLREAKTVNFQVARKMPYLFTECGFRNVDWQVMTSAFKGDELSQEIENLEKSIENAASFAEKILGGANNLVRFQKEYFSALRQPDCVLFYNKVVAMGSKPIMKPKLVKSG